MTYAFRHILSGLALVAASGALTAEANPTRAALQAKNTVRVVQDGSANGAGIQQTGSGNAAGILQFGQGNTGTVLQDGSNNAACLVQNGRNLDASIQQQGNNQTTGVLQHRWGAEYIPVEVCATAATKREALSYGSSHPRTPLRPRVR
ncbi:MAG: hypothetical protein ACO33A_14595 [Hyphomonas sp.]